MSPFNGGVPVLGGPAAQPQVTLSSPLPLDGLLTLTAAALRTRGDVVTPAEAMDEAIELFALASVAGPKVAQRIRELKRGD